MDNSDHQDSSIERQSAQENGNQTHKQEEQVCQKGNIEDNDEKILSKKQLKKQLKKAKWQQIKKIKRKEQRQKQKQKRKQKKEKLKQQMIEKGEMEEKIQQKQQGQRHTKRRKDQYKQKMMDGLKVVIDMQFYDLMTEKQITSLGKQLAYCHSINRKLEKPFNYIITSLTESRREYMAKKYSIDNYGITLREQNLLETFEHDKIVYLTGDAEDQLEEFDPEQIYIIGGIVDHNRLRNITINYAKENNLKAKRLPMSGLKLKASVHLAVNHVWEWMLRHYNGSSWKQSIKAVIPERKLQQCEKAAQKPQI